MITLILLKFETHILKAYPFFIIAQDVFFQHILVHIYHQLVLHMHPQHWCQSSGKILWWLTHNIQSIIFAPISTNCVCGNWCKNYTSNEENIWWTRLCVSLQCVWYKWPWQLQNLNPVLSLLLYLLASIMAQGGWTFHWTLHEFLYHLQCLWNYIGTSAFAEVSYLMDDVEAKFYV